MQSSVNKIYLYSQDFFWPVKLKTAFKKILRKNFGGPQNVQRNLICGLETLGCRVFLDEPSPAPVVGVLSGIKTLQWAIKKKQLGKVKRIIAGPNIVISPNDEGKILRHPLIDEVVVPSQWVKDYYASVAPEILEKIKIWPSGVDEVKTLKRPKTNDFLIYNKVGDNKIVELVKQQLLQGGFSFKILEYGKFNQTEYFKILNSSKYEIYLSNSESQGLAMFEAWARGVPVLAWEHGIFKKGGVTVSGKISAPFLNPEAGMSFSNQNDFQIQLERFMGGNFDPASYIERNFTNLISAQKYLNICYGK